MHLLDNEHGACSMPELYDAAHLIPTSHNADVVLIRSHIAYHAGRPAAHRAEINASRGHSYRVDLDGTRYIVRISDHYDHKLGVMGFDPSCPFTLRNDPPKHTPQRFEQQDKTLQKVCVEGMDCLPGQMDLF